MALDFEAGSSESLDMGLDIPALNAKAACTIMAWINLESTGVNRAIAQIAEGPPPGTTGVSRLLLNVNDGGLVRITVRPTDGGSPTSLSTSSGVITTGTLFHVAAVANIAGDALLIYVDGVLDSSSTPSFTPTAFSSTNSKNGHIASDDLGSGVFWDGTMEDFRLYSRALSAAEILTIFTARGNDGIVQGLENRYTMNEKEPGATASGAGTVIDVGPDQRNVDPVNTPAYVSSNLRFRRSLP